MSKLLIIGNQNPEIGKEYYYSLSIMGFGSMPNNIFNPHPEIAKWEIHVLENGKWRKTKGNSKQGNTVPYTFNQSSLTRKGIKICVTKGDDTGELVIKPKRARQPKINKIELLDVNGNKVTKPLSYSDTLSVKAYCTDMEGETVQFTLWEDDAKREGHNKINAINKINAFPVPGTVRKGVAIAKFNMATYTMASFIANMQVAKGDKNEGKTHEYYATAEYFGKLEASNNVNLKNPAHPNPTPTSGNKNGQTKPPAKRQPNQKPVPPPPAPKKDTYKTPVTSKAKTQSPDPQGKIVSAEFVDLNGKPYKNMKFGTHVRAKIVSKNMIGKTARLKIWEDDINNQKLFEKDYVLYADESFFTLFLTAQMRKDGDDLLEGSEQEYFLEIEYAGQRVDSEVINVNDSAPKIKVAEPAVSMTGVGADRESKPQKGECFCNREFEDKEVANIIKQLRILTGHKDTVNLWYKQTTPKMDDKSLAGFVKELNANFNHYNIKTCSQKMHFLAHACVETGAFSKAREGGTDLSYDPWRGHGLLQLTKESAYEKYDAKENKNLVAKPEKIAENLHLTVDSGCWTWSDFKKMPSDKNSQAVKRWGEETAGKSLNQLALYGDKYLELISALLNGRNAKTDMPNGWEERKAAYDHLRNFIFKYDYYHGDKSKQVNTKDIVTYHIYANGDIEKHIPKKIKEGYEQKYKFIYHDEGNAEHELCIATWHTTTKKLFSARKLYSKPTHNRIISDKNVSDGQTTRRVIYENGDIAEYGSNDGDTFWRLYSSTSEKIELVEMPENVKYVKYSFSGTQRRYTGPNYFAGFLGALAKSGLSVVTTGSCFKYGSCFPSQFHVNGESVDTSYFWDLKKDQLFVDAMRSFHYGEIKVGAFNGRKHGAYFSSLKNVSDGGTLHNSHFHSGKFNISKIKIIKE